MELRKTTYVPLPPEDFDFSKYEAENIALKQESKSNGEFGIVASFQPMSTDIDEHHLIINNNDVSTSSTATPNCKSGIPVRMPIFLLNDDNDIVNKDVGTNMTACIKGIWKDSTMKKTSGTWKALEDGKARENPQACRDYVIKFQTRVNFIVKDLFNTVGIENAVITFTIGKYSFSGTTDKTGKFSENILVDDLDPGTTSAELHITDVTVSIDINFPNEACGNILTYNCACFTMIPYIETAQ